MTRKKPASTFEIHIKGKRTIRRVGRSTFVFNPVPSVPLPPSVNLTTRMHLSQAQEQALIPILKHFVKTGELPKEDAP